MERKNIVQTPELKSEYNLEQAETAWKINRVVAPISIIIPAVLIIFSDKVNFPDFYSQMLTGRMYAIILGSIVVISSLFPKLKKYGQIFIFLLFLGFSLMSAHLSAVMNNENSTLTSWIFISIIGCGLLPFSISYTALVVILSFIYYVIIFLSSGFYPDLAFRMTFINIGAASIVAMAFKHAQTRIREREFFFRKSLRKANVEIEKLNEKLKDENIHLTTELEVAKHIQTIVLPQKDEYSQFADLEISCLMIPADEVGGDYYDTISFGKNGFITMGDVTDHGLHSGLIMMMVHTAIRALSQIEKNDIKKIFIIINKLLFDFRHKTSDRRIMTLLILKYMGKGKFELTGQHESLLIISPDGNTQDLSLLDYGMFAGLEENVEPYLDTLQFEIKKNDILILYTDGITEAMNSNNEEYGKSGILKSAVPVRKKSADKIKKAIIDDCLKHMGHEKLHDDMSIMIIKKTV